MSNIVKFPTPPTTDEYFGGCPECGKNDGYSNIGRVHWCQCDEHKTKWRIGENLFSCWQEETEEDWARESARLALYRIVEPIHAERETCCRCGAYGIKGELHHDKLCRMNGVQSPLDDDTVRAVIAYLSRHRLYIARQPSPQDDDGESIPQDWEKLFNDDTPHGAA